MNSPKKRESKVLQKLSEGRDRVEFNRTRTSMLLASRIINAMKSKGWNKITLAEKMNKKPSVITRWLSGAHNFTSDTLSDIQEVLSIKLLSLESSENTPILLAGIPPRTVNLTLNIFDSNNYAENMEGETISFLAVASGAWPSTIKIENLN
jgi:transcriptional regulator with XRE-family HTH domain